MKVFQAFFGAMLLAHPALACDESSIETLSEDGDLISLDDGQSYDVLAGDQPTAAAWTEGDDVLVRNDKIINKGSGETVEVTPH